MTRTKGLAGYTRRTDLLTPFAYTLERPDGTALARHDTVEALLRNVEGKGACLIRRRRDGAVVFRQEGK